MRYRDPMLDMLNKIIREHSIKEVRITQDEKINGIKPMQLMQHEDVKTGDTIYEFSESEE